MTLSFLRKGKFRIICNMKYLGCTFLIVILLTTLFACEGKKKRLKKCLDQKVLSDTQSKEGEIILQNFEDTLVYWKSVISDEFVKRYNFMVDGLILSNDKSTGAVFLILQKKYSDTSGDQMKLIVYRKIDNKINFYHPMNLGFSRSHEAKKEKPIPIDSLRMYYRNSLIENYGMLDNIYCELDGDFVESWITADYYHANHQKWLANPERF
jgi:hypothetical protein